MNNGPISMRYAFLFSFPEMFPIARQKYTKISVFDFALLISVRKSKNINFVGRLDELDMTRKITTEIYFIVLLELYGKQKL